MLDFFLWLFIYQLLSLNKKGEACKKAGIGFAYHNHDAEFRAVKGKVPYDLFLSQTSTDTVKMEIDLACAVKGGKDPVALFKQHPGRFPFMALLILIKVM